MRRFFWLLLLAGTYAVAADWQFLGASDTGAYYADRHSLKWEADQPVFTIATNVIEKDKTEWHTVIRIDCSNSTFTYMRGARLQDGKPGLMFDKPRSTEKILEGTMPHMLKSEYCGAMPASDSSIVRWEPAGKSNVANVYFDRASLKQNKDGFVIDTKVVPFNHEEETYGTVSFSCTDDTFTMLKLNRFKDGRMEHVFDKPQPPLKTSKMTTLAIVADKFCGKQKSPVSASAADPCVKALADMRRLELAIQKDADEGGLQCKQVQGYLKQIDAIATASGQHGCTISGLDAYRQQVKTADCMQ